MVILNYDFSKNLYKSHIFQFPVAFKPAKFTQLEWAQYNFGINKYDCFELLLSVFILIVSFLLLMLI